MMANAELSNRINIQRVRNHNFNTFIPPKTSLFFVIPRPLHCGSKSRLQCKRILASEFTSAILDSNSEEAWGETKMRPREW